MFSKEHNQRVLRDFHNQGFNLTEEDLINLRKSIYDNIRAGLLLRGHKPPESDEDLFLLIQAALPSVSNCCQFCGSVIPPSCDTCFQCGTEKD